MIKKIIRKEFGIFEVVGETRPDIKFEKGKAYIVGDSVYIYWGECEPGFSRPGFFHSSETNGHVIFQSLSNSLSHDKYIMSIKDIEELDTDRLNETIKLFEEELYKYIKIKNAVSDNREALFKVTGSIDSIKIVSALSAMLNRNSNKQYDANFEAINIRFEPKHTEGIKITRNGETPKMLLDTHTDKNLNGFRYQFYEYK